jgi:uncharacterized protein YfaS (alpha-2-macroglobulin family)
LAGCTDVPLTAGQGECSATFAGPGTVEVVANFPGSGDAAASVSPSTAVQVSGLAITPQPITFPETALGTPSAEQALTVTNTSLVAATVSAVLVQGGDASAFATSSDGCTGTALNPGASCAVVITYTPDVAGSSVSSLDITDSAAAEPQQISLTGSAS